MKRILRFITQVYGKLIKLFPVEFQGEFGEELQVVFSEMIGSAVKRSKLAFAIACLQELRDFPILLVRSHLEKRNMLKIFRSQPVRLAFRGAIVFSLGLACVSAFSIIFAYWLSTFFDPMNTGWTSLVPALTGYALASLIGGLLFALLFSERTQFGWYALVGILGWLIPQATTFVLVMSFWSPILDYNQLAILHYAEIALTGAFLSMMFNIAKSNKRAFLWPLFFAAVLFPILAYLIPQLLLHSSFFSPLLLIHFPWFFIAILIMVILYIAAAIVLAIKSDRRGLWMVIAGTLGYPLVVYLCSDVIVRFHLYLPQPVTGFLMVDVINQGIISILEGIIFGVILGLIIGWQGRSIKV